MHPSCFRGGDCKQQKMTLEEELFRLHCMVNNTHQHKFMHQGCKHKSKSLERNLSLLHSFAWVSSGTLCPISGTKFLRKSCQLEMWRIYCFNSESALLQKTTLNASLNLWLVINSFRCAYPHTLSKDNYQPALQPCSFACLPPPALLAFHLSPQNRQTQMTGGKPTQKLKITLFQCFRIFKISVPVICFILN